MNAEPSMSSSERNDKTQPESQGETLREAELGFQDREVDAVQPFFLENTGIRGRMLRLESAIDAVLKRHRYPEPAARLLGELMALTGLLSSLLKFEGTFTLQSKSDGPISAMVADMTSAGVVRGYLNVNREALSAMLEGLEDGQEPTLGQLVGEGYLAFTVDQPGHADRYQAIVALEGESLAECLQNYFRQSDQVESGVLIKVDQVADEKGEKHWRAGGIIVQLMPDEGGSNAVELEDGATSGMVRDGDERKEDWSRTMVLLSSCSREELLDSALPMNDLLYRLFHEELVRVYDRLPLYEGCRCSREKLETVIKTIPVGELDQHKVDGRILASCEFCSRTYSFDDDDIAKIQAAD
ncbi:Hsp33 family molecular chaperone HslO [Kiloniella sp. b19]|uniref:Hsp33 family molecular chaperone HslO n=1 Tax=Kiloniella sp. GXU_MW_B19 TaxID=3141326 RepID=UPI0031D38BF2